MKKLVLIVGYVLTLSSPSFGQDDEKGFKIEEKPNLVLWSLEGAWTREGLAGSLNLRVKNIENALHFDKNFVVGLHCDNFFVGAHLGFEPVAKKWGESLTLNKVIVLSYDCFTNLFVAHDSLVTKTIDREPEMILSLKLGPSLEFANRVNIFVCGKPGLSWNPKKPLMWQTNVYYYWGWEIGIGVNLRMKKHSEKDED